MKADRRNGGQPLGGAPGERHGRRARAQVHHPHITPEHAAAQAGAQRLGAGLLGGEALGVAARPVGLALGASPLDLGEDAAGKPLAEALERLLDAADVREIGPQANDQAATSSRAASIKERIRRIAGSRPVKIASPIRKWPMFSSASSGMAAM